MSKTFAAVLLVTSMMALATVAHGKGGSFSGGGGNVPQPGTWNWPPYAEGGSLHYDHRYHHCWWRHGYRHCS
jgi:hypothetical protein